MEGRRAFEAEKRAALNAWALEIERILRGDAAESGNHVISPAAAHLDKFDAVNAEWRRAIEQADSTGNPQPLVAYLLKKRRLGTIETFFLRLLLDRVTFKHRSPGNRVPLGRKSRRDINLMGAALVRELQRTEGLTREAAIDRVAEIDPVLGAGAGAGLAAFMKRGET